MLGATWTWIQRPAGQILFFLTNGPFSKIYFETNNCQKLQPKIGCRISANDFGAEVGRGSANGPGVDIVPPWRPSQSLSRRGRHVSANRFGAEMANLSAKAVGAKFGYLEPTWGASAPAEMVLILGTSAPRVLALRWNLAVFGRVPPQQAFCLLGGGDLSVSQNGVEQLAPFGITGVSS